MSEFTVKGTPEQPVQVSGADLVAALSNGDNVFLFACEIVGAVQLKRAHVSGKLEVHCSTFTVPAVFTGSVFERELIFLDTRFREVADFSRSRLQSPCVFVNCDFPEGLSCIGTVCSKQFAVAGGELGKVSMWYAVCDGKVEFVNCEISGDLMCLATEFHGPLLLRDVAVRGSLCLEQATLQHGLTVESTELRGGGSLEGAVLDGPVDLEARYCGDMSWWRRAWSWLSRSPLPPHISVLGTNADSCANLVVRRWVQDTNWLAQWRQLHPLLFRVWLVSSDCGRSLAVWLLWALGISALFGALYSGLEAPAWLPERVAQLLVAAGPELRFESAQTPFAPYYYSIVAFSTLGFGDIYPTNTSGQVLVAVEVLIGYMMLGGLLAILANKIARRS